jgi:hypothetical protein
MLHHWPIDQFTSRQPLKAKQLFIIEHQQKFHQQVSKASVTTRLYKTSVKEKGEERDAISSESELESEEEEVAENRAPAPTFVHDSNKQYRYPSFSKNSWGILERCQSLFLIPCFWIFLW